MPTERFPIRGLRRPSTRRRARPARRRDPGLRAVRALLHLRQGRAGGQAHRGGAGGKGIAVLRFDFTGLGSSEGDFANSTFSSNVADLVRAADHLRADAQSAGDPDRPQPWRRCDPRRGRTNPRRKSGRHHRRTLRSRAMSPISSGIASRTSARTARSKSRSPAGRSTSSANSSTTSPSRPDGQGQRRCTRRCWSCIRRPTTPSASTTPRTSSSRPSIRRVLCRSLAPIIC